MRYIVCPEPVILTNIHGDVLESEGRPAAVTFKRFVFERFEDEKFLRGKSAASATFVLSDLAIRLRPLPFAPGEIIELEEETWASLRDVTSDPSGGYNRRIQHNFVPFIRAIIEATTERPGQAITETQKDP